MKRVRTINHELARLSTVSANQAAAAGRELAELRERIDTERAEWGYGPNEQDVTSSTSAVHAGEVARRRGEKRWVRIVGKWREADGDD